MDACARTVIVCASWKAAGPLHSGFDPACALSVDEYAPLVWFWRLRASVIPVTDKTRFPSAKLLRQTTESYVCGPGVSLQSKSIMAIEESAVSFVPAFISRFAATLQRD